MEKSRLKPDINMQVVQEKKNMVRNRNTKTFLFPVVLKTIPKMQFGTLFLQQVFSFYPEGDDPDISSSEEPAF